MSYLLQLQIFTLAPGDERLGDRFRPVAAKAVEEEVVVEANVGRGVNDKRPVSLEAMRLVFIKGSCNVG